MTISIVSTTAQLLAVLHGAQAGDIIKLAPGTYSGVTISGDTPKGATSTASQVFIESEFSTNPAVLQDLTVKNSHNLAFVDLKMSTLGDAIGTLGAAATIPFNIDNSANISLHGITLSGNPTGTLANTISGLFIRNSSYVTVSGSSFSYLHDAISQLDNDHISITGNAFSHIYDDGVRGGGTSNITISNNSFTVFHPDPTDTDHPDLIQFWTTDQTKSVSNITVNNNTFIRGAGGGEPQGLFIRDEVGDLPYYNVVAEYNNFTGTGYNGINFRDVDGGVLKYNTVTSYTDYNSSIDVYDGSKDVLVEYNHAQSFMYTGSTDLTILGNTLTQPLPIPAPTVKAMAFAMEDDVGLSSPVPEAGTWAFATAGLGLIGAVRRKVKPRLGAST